MPYTKKDRAIAEHYFSTLNKKELLGLVLDYREGYFRMLDVLDARPTQRVPDSSKASTTRQPRVKKSKVARPAKSG